METQLYEAAVGDYLGYQGNVFITFSFFLGVWLGGWLWLVWLPTRVFVRVLAAVVASGILLLVFAPGARASTVPTVVTGVQSGTALFNALLAKPLYGGVARTVGTRTTMGVASALGRLSPAGTVLTVGSTVLSWCLSSEVCLAPKNAQPFDPMSSQTGQPYASTTPQQRPITGWTFTSNTCSPFTSEGSARTLSALNTGDGQGHNCTSPVNQCGGITNCYWGQNGGVVVAAKAGQPTYGATTVQTAVAAYDQSSWTGNSAGNRTIWGTYGDCPSGSSAGTSGSNYGYCFGTFQLCSAGWTLTGGQCLNASAYPSDGKPSFRADGSGGWMSDMADPDNAGISVPSGTITRTGVDDFGNPSSDSIQSIAGGNIVYSQSTQLTANGATNTTTNSYTIDAAGTVTNVTSKTTGGTLADVPANGSAQAGQPVSPGEIPNDYAREATLQDVRTNTSGAGVPTGGGAFDGASAAVDAAHQERTAGLSDATNANGKDTSWGISLNLPAPACEPFPLWDGIVLQWCPYVEMTRTITGWLWGLTTVWCCFGMVGTAMRGGA